MQRLQPTRMVVSFNEELKVFPKLVVAVVVVAFDSRFFEGAVHPLYLAIGPWMVGLGQSVFDVVLEADLIEAVTRRTTSCHRTPIALATANLATSGR